MRHRSEQFKLLIDDHRYTVYAPGTDIPVDTVATRITDDGLSVTNTTDPGHIFHDGEITRTATQNANGSWSVTTISIGNNVLPGAAFVNEMTGPSIFRNLDSQMAANIAAHHGSP